MLKFSLKSQKGIVTFISRILQKAWVRFDSLFDLRLSLAVYKWLYFCHLSRLFLFDYDLKMIKITKNSSNDDDNDHDDDYNDDNFIQVSRYLASQLLNG